MLQDVLRLGKNERDISRLAIIVKADHRSAVSRCPGAAASMKSIYPRCDSGSFSTSSRQRSEYQGCFSNNVFIIETVRGLSFSRIRYAIAPVTMCVEVFQADAEQAKKEHDNRGIHNK